MADGKISVKMDSRERALWTGMQKIIGQQVKMQDGYRKVAKTSKTASDQQRRGMTRTGQDIANIAVQYIGLQAAIRGVTRVTNEMASARERAKQASTEGARGVGTLAQLAETPAQMKGLERLSMATFAEGGADTIEQAGRLIFSLESAGAMKQRKLFSEMQAIRLVEDSANMAASAAAMQAALGTKETGSMRALVSKAFGASPYSPSSAEAIITAAAQSGSMAGPLGISDEEMLAAVGVVSKPAKGAELAGTRVKALIKGLSLAEGEQFKGMSLKEAVKDIESRNLTPEGFVELMGARSEARIAYLDMLGNMDLYDQALKDVQTAERKDLVGTKLKLAESVDWLAAEKQKRIAKNKEVLTEMKGIGVSANLAEAAVSEWVTAQRDLAEWGNATDRQIAEIDIAYEKGYTAIAETVFGAEWVRENVRMGRSPSGLRELAGLIGPSPKPQGRYEAGSMFDRFGGVLHPTTEEKLELYELRKQTALLENLDARREAFMRGEGRMPTLKRPDDDR